MKRPLKYLSHFTLGVLFWAAFFIPTAFAQTGHFVLLNQSNLSTSTSQTYGFTFSDFTIQIGSGYQGTTTSAFASFLITNYNSSQQNVTFTLSGDDSSNCVYDLNHNPNFINGNTIGDNPVQLYFATQVPHSDGVSGCTFEPQVTYTIDIFYRWWSSLASPPIPFYLRGAPTNTTGWIVTPGGQGASNVAVPQFAIAADNFQISPTASSSGFFLSGAQAFCNDQFSSSTGIGASITNGLCQVVGYLFIPTPLSVQSFQDIPLSLESTPPISWFTEIKNTITSEEASTTDNFINLTLNFGTSTAILGFNDLTVISTDTIARYLPDSTRVDLRNLIAVTFYLLTASLIYFQIKNLWKST